MTRDEFLSMDWGDSQIGYDMQVERRTVIVERSLI